MKSMRLASKAMGDDNTLTRYVQIPGAKPEAWRNVPMPPDADGTRYKKAVKRVDQVKSLLTSGHNNVKIGRDVRIGKLKGYWIYTLALEERATCPTSCHHWEDCYGNNLHLSKRIDHTDPDFLPVLEAEIQTLMWKHQGKVLIRLHVLGDFYSEEYVEFWRRQLEIHPTLHIWGYTARSEGVIHAALYDLYSDMPDRFAMRGSDVLGSTMCTVSIDAVEECPPNAFVCPEQTVVVKKSGVPVTCATCGLCWSTDKNVAFLRH